MPMLALPQVDSSPSEIKIVHRPCPECLADNCDQPPSPYSLSPWIIRDCATCGFVYIDSAPEYQHLAVEMAWETTFVENEIRLKKTVPLLHRIDKLTRWRVSIVRKKRPSDFILRYFSSGRVLDLGCAGGDVVKDLLGAFTPYGVEISTKLAREADALFRQHGGYAENAPCLEGLERFPESFIDAVVARSYLEHELHPLEVLREIFRVLKPGGIAVVKVPNYACWNRVFMGKKWCGFRYPDHLNYFTPRSLTRFAVLSGFSIDLPLLDRLPTDDNMWAVLTKPAE